MNAWQWLVDLNKLCKFQTREGKRVGTASNSEIKRWLMNGAVKLNGETVQWNEPMDFPVISVKLFTKDATVTLW